MDEAAIGKDGLAMLALSTLVMVVSLGTTLLAASFHVVRVGAATPATAPPSPVIIVPGMRLRPDGTPGLQFRRRLDRARLLLLGSSIVLLGGSTRPVAVTEAEAGRRYLQSLGVNPDQMRLEDRSRHTLENLRHYRALFGGSADAPPVLVTSRFHIARCALLARGLRLALTPCAAEDHASVLLRQVPRILMEAALIHWYMVGRTYARWAGNHRMVARIT